MKKTLLFLGLIPFFCQSQSSQAARGTSGTRYIFNYDIQVSECDQVGNLTVPANNQIIDKGSTFVITSITSKGYIIVVDKYKLDSGWNKNSEKYKSQLDKRARLNFKSSAALGLMSVANANDNVYHFYIGNEDFNSYASEYTSKWQWNFGTLVEPFKFRSKPSIFTTNLSLGQEFGFQRPITNSSKNFTWGAYAGLSLSSVTLDSLSTNGKVTTNTERPAFTPSINLIIGYQSIDITFGIGWDFINRTSALEKNWVYQGSRWFAIGLGFKLFTPNTNNTTKTQSQAASY